MKSRLWLLLLVLILRWHCSMKAFWMLLLLLLLMLTILSQYVNPFSGKALMGDASYLDNTFGTN